MKKILIAVLIIFTLFLFSFCGNTDDEAVQNDDSQATSISETDASESAITDEATTEEAAQEDAAEITEATAETTTQEASEVPAVIPTEAPTEAPTVAPTEAPTEAPTQAPVVSTTKAETMVWIPSSGSKYHRSASCSNMKNPSQVTLEQAQNWGYEPCKKCY